MSYLDRGASHVADVGKEVNANSMKSNTVDNDDLMDSKVTELQTAWDVDRHIVLDSADKVVLVRFSSYCTPPDEIVFSGLRSTSKEENPKEKRAGWEEGKLRKHRSSSSSKRKRNEEEESQEQGEENTDEDDDLLDTLESIENRKRKKKKTTGGDKEHRHHHHHGHASSSTSRRTHDASNAVPPPHGGTSSANEAGMEHYLATQRMDAMLMEMAPKVRKFCKIFTVDTSKVTEFNSLYELGHNRDPFALMFFYRNTHIKMDVGTGNNNKINFFAFEDWSELLSMVEAAYRAGKLGKHMASIDRKYSTVSLKR